MDTRAPSQLSYTMLRHRAQLVNDYRHQCELTWGDALPPNMVVEPIEPKDALGPYEVCVAKIEVMLATPIGRVALGVGTKEDMPESDRPPNYPVHVRARQLAVLFMPNMDIKAEAKMLRIDSCWLHAVLRSAFRTLAVVERSNPELFERRPPMAQAVPAVHCVAASVQDLRQRMEMALDPQEQQVIAILNGFFDLRQRTREQLAGDLGVSPDEISRIEQRALRKMQLVAQRIVSPRAARPSD